MGVVLSEPTGVFGAVFDDRDPGPNPESWGPYSADMLAGMMSECLRTGSLDTRLPVPGFVDSLSKRRDLTDSVLNIVSEEFCLDGPMRRILQVLGRATATDPEARALVADLAASYGRFHGGGR